jgi:hypothetical protein
MFLSGILILQPVNTNSVQGTEKWRTYLFKRYAIRPHGIVVTGTMMESKMSVQHKGGRRTQDVLWWAGS